MDSTTFIRPQTYTAGSFNSFKDWHLMKTVPTKISEAKVKELTVDIPGGDGSIDLSEALTGFVAYNNRTYQDTFVYFGDRKKWKYIVGEIRRVLDGKPFEIELDELKGWVYVGRPMITDFKEDENGHFTITVGCTIEPWRYEKYYSDDDEWLWDTFNFEDGIIRAYCDLVVADTLLLNIRTRKQRIFPYFRVDNAQGLECSFGGNSFELKGGYIDDIVFTEGDNTIIFINYSNAPATVSIRFRAGDI